MNTINTETGEILTDGHAQASLFAKLARAMGKLNRLPKNGHNDHFNYAFVTDGDVSDAVRQALAGESVAFFATMRDVKTDGKKTVVDFIFTFADGETGATWSCNWQGEAIDSQDKGTAKAATSALKYFLLKTFILSTGDPADDSDSAGEVKESKRKQPKAAGENGGGGKLGGDAMTTFWRKARELESQGTFTGEQAKALLKKCGNDPVKALDELPML